MNGTNYEPASMNLVPAEQMLDIYEKIISELIATFDLDEETIDSEPLPAPVV